MNVSMNKILGQVMQTLEAKFGLMNDAMTRQGKSDRAMFFNTSDPRVKVCVQCNLNKKFDATDVFVSVAVEEEDRKGMFFALGDRLHFDVEKFPEFKFHKDLAAKLSFSSARTDLDFCKDVVGFAKELTEKLA